MKLVKKYWAVLLVVIAAAGGAWWWFRPEQQITRFYQKYLGRAISPTELAARVSAYKAGRTLAQQEQEIAASPEATAYKGRTGT